MYPTEEQQQFLRGQFGAVRYCYNKAVAIKKHRYKVHGESLSVIKDIKPLLTKAKNYTITAGLSNTIPWRSRKRPAMQIRPKAEGLSVSARGGCVSHNDSCAVAVEPRSPSIY
ncbi:helix-turn-helix domain-containing protein [Duodenibacillus massiliensis]|uniref:helix-turn-helix domain-containing protein n=1 Tax=Duodenibacillus massiliensis TaxID=1852381 RepID=UPI003C6C903C